MQLLFRLSLQEFAMPHYNYSRREVHSTSTRAVLIRPDYDAVNLHYTLNRLREMVLDGIT